MVVRELVWCEGRVEFARIEECASFCTIASELIQTQGFDVPCICCVQHLFARSFGDGGSAWVLGCRVRDTGEDVDGWHVCLLGEEELEHDV
jgi:hypothetical protein